MSAATQPSVVSAESAVHELAEAASNQSVGDFLGSDGTITLSEQPPPPAGADDLFSKGSFTDYGVALTNAAEDIGANQTPDHGNGDVSLAKVSPAESDEHTDGKAGHHTDTAPAVAEFTNALDEALLRGTDGVI